MGQDKEKAGFICVKDTIDGAYPSLVLGINAARQGMESKIFYSFEDFLKFSRDCKICLFT
jgi:peroxiredoxin family protein